MPANNPAHKSFAGMARSYGLSEHLGTSSNTQSGQSLSFQGAKLLSVSLVPAFPFADASASIRAPL